MKYFVCILAAALLAGALALTNEQKTRQKKRTKECQTETGVSDEALQKAHNGEFVDDPKLKEHFLCTSKKHGTINDAGEIQVDVLKRKIKYFVKDNDEVDKIVEECAVKKATPLETAFELTKCVHKRKHN